jgi:hypothetical protein
MKIIAARYLDTVTVRAIGFRPAKSGRIDAQRTFLKGFRSSEYLLHQELGAGWSAGRHRRFRLSDQ